MPIAVSSTSRERRVGSGGGGSNTRSVSVGGGSSSSRRGKSSTSHTTKSSSSSTVPPPIIRTSSPSSPPVKGILVNKPEQQQHEHEDKDDSNDDVSSTSTASSYLKPLLKYLPRHIDPSTIARLLKNVHPSAFGSYRTKEAWRREHPQVLDAAYSLQNTSDDIESTHAVIRPSTSSDEVCLAHSPPSATFSSSEDDADGEGDFDEDYITYRNGKTVDDDDEDDEYDRREAKELEDYFNDEFDADLGTSPESSTSSLKDLGSRSGGNNGYSGYSHDEHAWSNGSNDINDITPTPSSASSSRRTSTNRRTRANSQDSNTTSATAKNDNFPSTSTSAYLEEPTASLTSPRSPLAIYLSKPDEEHDSPLAGPSQRVLDTYYKDNNNNSSDNDSSSVDEANDSGATITFSNLHSHTHSHKQVEDHYRQPIASTSAAILYPDFKRRDSVELTNGAARTPPSPSTLSPSHRANSNTRRTPSATRSHSQTYSANSQDPHSRPPSQRPQFPIPPTTATTTTMTIPRIIKRQSSSSSIASSSRSACTCRSTTSNLSSASNRSSSITFAPLPEEEIAIARRESRTRNGGSAGAGDKSRVMGIKGRRNLLLGIGVIDDVDSNDGSPAPSSPSASSNNGKNDPRRSVFDESDEHDIAEESDESDDDDDNPFSRRSRFNDTSKDQFDALAYFGEEDLLNPPPPAGKHTAKSTTSKTSHVDKGTSADRNQKKVRKDSDVTIRLGKNGELVERRPLGVTLEELTLPMKRVKETRGRSRQTNDLSALYSSSKTFSSPPLSPSSSSTFANLHRITSPPISPSRLNGKSKEEESWSSSSPMRIEMGITPHDASHEKTPTPTPRLEKKRLDLFTSVTPLSPPSTKSANLQGRETSRQALPTSSSPVSSSTHRPLSIATSHTNQSGSSTSPTHSLHSNGPSSSSGSNDITPMPTPRAGSPIAGLKMTTSIFEERGEASSREFKLVDTFTTRNSGSRSPSGAEEGGDLKVHPVSNILALGTLLDDPASSEGTSQGISPLNATAGGRPPNPNTTLLQTSGAEQEGQSESEDNGDSIEDEDEEEEAETSEDGNESESSNFDKTPTPHTSLDLPKLNDPTAHALHSRYRKKRSVGIPHGVTAKKKPIAGSRKSKKT